MIDAMIRDKATRCRGDKVKMRESKKANIQRRTSNSQCRMK